MEKKKYNAAMIIRCVLSSLVWGGVLAVNASMLSVSYGVFGAFLGGVIGFLSGEKLAYSKLRLPALIIGGLLLDRILIFLSDIPVDSALLADIMSPSGAVYISQGLNWFINSCILVAVLHCISVRKPWFIAFELIIVANIALLPLAGHREGFISRPYFFVDPLWSRGFDPIPFFVAVGAALTVAIILLILGRGNKRSTVVDFTVLTLIVIITAIFLPIQEYRQPLPEQLFSMNNQDEADSQDKTEGKDPDKQDKNDKDSKDNSGGDSGNQKDKDNQQGGQNDKDNPQNNQDNKDNNGNSGSDNNEKDKDDDSPPPQPKPVAVVTFDTDYTPPEGYFYFRQNVNSFFNGQKLVPNTDGKYDHDIASGFPEQGAENVLTPPAVEPSIVKRVSAKVSLVENHDRPFGLINPIKMKAAKNPNTSQFVGAYSVESACYIGKLTDILNLKLNNPNWSKGDIGYYTDLPKDPRYERLAKEICSKLPAQYADNPMAKVIALKLWLDKNCTYDLRVVITDPNDAVAKFLFGDRIGYCTHLANAMAYLCRASGIPARVANGYASDAKNTYGGSALLLMSNNSHAWCEIYLQGLGWYPIDISPEKSNAVAMDPPDADLQKMLGEMARDETSDEEGVPTQPKDAQKDMRALVRVIGYFLLLCLIGAVIACYVHKIYIHVIAHFGTDKVRAARIYKASLTCLAEIGVRRRYGETREEFAERLHDKVPVLQELTQYYVRSDFGYTERFSTYLPLPDDKDLAADYSALKKSLGNLAPWWRRLIGIINPFSWLFVK